jgi:ubiquinone/menaquinone biosynthesis C-methylase UbiE
MRLFHWFRRASQESEGSEERVPRRWAWVGGRRFFSQGAYIFPKDKLEGERLDLQHYLLKVAVGSNYRAPIRQPRAILDVACGTGIWGRELALEFKRAQVVGFDIDRTPMEAALARLGPAGQFPANFHFLEANALDPFPVQNGAFDFTHARLISPFVPVSRWPDVVAEMVRVTRPGGYIELVDMIMAQSESQAFNALRDAGAQVMTSRGLHAGSGPYLAEYLRQAGLQRVQERRVVLGTGSQGRRVQKLIASDLLAALSNMQPLLVKMGLFSAADFAATLARAQAELATCAITWTFTFAFSLKL